MKRSSPAIGQLIDDEVYRDPERNGIKWREAHIDLVVRMSSHERVMPKRHKKNNAACGCPERNIHIEMVTVLLYTTLIREL